MLAKIKAFRRAIGVIGAKLSTRREGACSERPEVVDRNEMGKPFFRSTVLKGLDREHVYYQKRQLGP